MGDLCPLAKSCDQEIPPPINESFVLERWAHSFCSASALSAWLRQRKWERKTNKGKEKRPSTVELKQPTPAPSRSQSLLRQQKVPHAKPRHKEWREVGVGERVGVGGWGRKGNKQLTIVGFLELSPGGEPASSPH